MSLTQYLTKPIINIALATILALSPLLYGQIPKDDIEIEISPKKASGLNGLVERLEEKDYGNLKDYFFREEEIPRGFKLLEYNDLKDNEKVKFERKELFFNPYYFPDENLPEFYKFLLPNYIIKKILPPEIRVDAFGIAFYIPKIRDVKSADRFILLGVIRKEEVKELIQNYENPLLKKLENKKDLQLLFPNKKTAIIIVGHEDDGKGFMSLKEEHSLLLKKSIKSLEDRLNKTQNN